ncbi:MAG: hypothetical protein ACREEM_44480 [Blastocatellia bacterium]
MRINRPSLLILLLGLLPIFSQAQEAQPLSPNTPIEREIAGGQTHIYVIKWAAGQFLRVMAWQKGIDLAVALADPEGKQIKDLSIPLGTTVPESINFRGLGPQRRLSHYHSHDGPDSGHLSVASRG